MNRRDVTYWAERKERTNALIQDHAGGVQGRPRRSVGLEQDECRWVQEVSRGSVHAGS